MPAIRAIPYPCLCLCFWFEQITNTTPWRRTILHFTQIFLTDDLTFTFLPFPPHDAAPAQVVGHELHHHRVPRPQAQQGRAARHVGGHLAAALALQDDAIERVLQLLPYRPHRFDHVPRGLRHAGSPPAGPRRGTAPTGSRARAGSPPPTARSGRRGSCPSSPPSSRPSAPRPRGRPRSAWARWPGTGPAPVAPGGPAGRSSGPAAPRAASSRSRAPRNPAPPSSRASWRGSPPPWPPRPPPFPRRPTPSSPSAAPAAPPSHLAA